VASHGTFTTVTTPTLDVVEPFTIPTPPPDTRSRAGVGEAVYGQPTYP
jgi:hypothetical protein